MYWSKEMLERLLQVVCVEVASREGKLNVTAVDISRVERFVDTYLGLGQPPPSHPRPTTVSSISRDTRFTTSSSLDFQSKYMNKD
jgi:hypothetical protein